VRSVLAARRPLSSAPSAILKYFFDKGSKVAVMGTNTARVKVLNDIESASDLKAVRFQSTISENHFNTTVVDYLHKIAPIGTDIQKALENAKLFDSRSKTVGSLSAVERARLQLAGSILNAPELLLIDQPTHVTGETLTLDDVLTLQGMISKYPKVCVVNSSDSDFLNSFANHVLYASTDGKVERFNKSYENTQHELAHRYLTVAKPKVEKLTLKERLTVFALLLPIEFLLPWALCYSGR